jgi:hypothetical protein
MGIEYCSGMIEEGGYIIATVGLRDREGWIYRMDKKMVEEMFIRVDDDIRRIMK